jgi:hypothetical protein
MEFPAVSHTRVEFWQEKHYTKSGMWWFTVFFGWFGLHHLLLKSPQTAILVFLGNVFLFGYPLLYDLIQLSSPEYGGLSDQELEEFGLGYPFGALGLAKGMWVPDGYTPKYSPYKENSNSDKPLMFFLYCLLCPIGLIGSLIAGDYANAAARIANIFPLSFFFIGLISEFICIITDIITVIFSPAELVFGIKRPLIFRSSFLDEYIYPGLTMHTDSHSPNIMPKYFATNMANYEKSKKFGDSIKTPDAKANANANAYKPPSNTNAPAPAPNTNAPAPAPNTNAPPKPNTPVASSPATPTQGGGGNTTDKTPLDYFAFMIIAAVIGGGVLLSAGRTANGSSPEKNDSPPNARNV